MMIRPTAETLKQKLQVNTLAYQDLSGLDLSFYDLRKENLQYANLRRTNLYRADLRGADFWWTNLSGACLHKARIEDTGVLRIHTRYEITLYPDGRLSYGCETLHVIKWEKHLLKFAREYQKSKAEQYYQETLGILQLCKSFHMNYIDSLIRENK